MKRLYFVLIIFAILSSLLLFFCSFNSKAPRVVVIDRLKLDQLRLGLRQSDVENILGLKPGDYTSGECSIRNPPLLLISNNYEYMPETSIVRWKDDSTNLSIAFDDSGKLKFAFACTHQLK